MRYGILDKLVVSFRERVVLEDILHAEENLAFRTLDLRKGYDEEIYERISIEEMMDVARTGIKASSALEVCQGDGDERKESFVINFKRK